MDKIILKDMAFYGYVDIVRVHDITENLRAAKMADAIYR